MRRETGKKGPHSSCYLDASAIPKNPLSLWDRLIHAGKKRDLLSEYQYKFVPAPVPTIPKGL